MKKLPITKEAFEKSRYFKNKYGKLEYVSESGKVFKTDKGKILMFKEDTIQRLSKIEIDVINKILTNAEWDEFQVIGDTSGQYFIDGNDKMSVEDGLNVMCDSDLFSLGGWEEVYGLSDSELKVWDRIVDKFGLDESAKSGVYPTNPSYSDTFKESTKKLGRKFAKESIDSEVNDVRKTIETELNSMADRLNEFKHLAIEKLKDKKLAKDLENIENQVAEVYYDV